MLSRRLLLLAALAATALLPVTPAHAGLNTWTGLVGLDDTNASWVREFDAATPPTTIYAATEGYGVWQTTNDGLTWNNISGNLVNFPGALDVRTVYPMGSDALAGTSGGLFKYSGGSWTPLAQGAEDDPQHPKKLNHEVQTLYSSAGKLLAGVVSGGVYSSTDDGATWTPPAQNNGMPTGETVWSLGQLVPGVVFAATSDGVFRSFDGGSTWSYASDGISGTTFRIFVDGHNPLIYYAGTSDGLFRSINGGVTWGAENGPVGHTLGNPPILSMQQFFGNSETRIYATTYNGLYAGTSSNNTTGGVIPGPITWRPITNNGLNGHTELWAITNFTTTPGTLLAGSHGGGGFSLTFQPPSNTAAPTLTDTTPAVGESIHTSNGTWTGTPTIEFSYQWQHCTSTSTASCSDIADATDNDYIVTQADKDSYGYLRSVITAENDFPTFGKVTKASAITSLIAAKPGSLPGDNQQSAASITSDSPNSGLPQSGYHLTATGWLFNPVASSTSFSWYSCPDSAGSYDPSTCDLVVANAASASITLKDTDVTRRFCVKVTGTNASGSTTLQCSGLSNTIFPKDPVNDPAHPPTVGGTPYVGSTLVGTAGLWTPSTTTYKRSWQQCDAGGAGCSGISGAHDATYVPTADDLGHTLRVVVTADSNEDNHFPGPVDVTSAPSAVVTDPPPPPAPPGGGGGGGTTTTPPGPTPIPDVTAPVLGTTKLASTSVTRGKPLSVSLTLSKPGSLRVAIARQKSGRKVKGTCKAGARKGTRCKATVVLGTRTFSGLPASAKISVPTIVKGKKLPRGSYLLIVTPVNALGAAGTPRTLHFRVH